MTQEGFIPKHGGFRNLISFRKAQLAYDVTVRFCARYVDARSRTRDQMIQAARSGVQNIAEGSLASATSKETEIKLTNVARASLGELQLDYEDFPRHRGLPIWERGNALRQALIDARLETADEVALWLKRLRDDGRTSASFPELAANAGVALCALAMGLLTKQIASLEKDFLENGGLRERMTRARLASRKKQNNPGT